MADEPLVYTVEEAAKALRIGRTAAYSAAKSGDLPVVRIGRSLRVPAHKLAELLGETESNGTGAASGPVGNPLPEEVDDGKQHRR